MLAGVFAAAEPGAPGFFFGFWGFGVRVSGLGFSCLGFRVYGFKV